MEVGEGEATFMRREASLVEGKEGHAPFLRRGGGVSGRGDPINRSHRSSGCRELGFSAARGAGVDALVFPDGHVKERTHLYETPTPVAFKKWSWYSPCPYSSPS